MDNYVAQAIHQIRELPAEEKRLGGGVGSATIADAETKLGCHFPEPYKAFLEAYGWGGPDGAEIFGLSDNLNPDEYPDLVRKNQMARTEDGLAPGLLAFETTGDGGYYVMNTAPDSDGAILVWYPWSKVEANDLERSDESFGEWLLRTVADTIALRDI
jgi:SMI1 / KNR4 family.